MIWRVVYMGTAEIACPPLRVLAGMPEIELAAVYTQPDRPRGRGQSVRFSPVKKLALDKGMPVLQPESLKAVSAVEELAALKPDVLVVMAYGQILPQQILDLPPRAARLISMLRFCRVTAAHRPFSKLFLWGIRRRE